MKTIGLVRSLAKAGIIRKGLEIDATIKNGKIKLELEIEYLFELNTTDKNEVIKQLATKLKANRSYIDKIVKFQP